MFTAFCVTITKLVTRNMILGYTYVQDATLSQGGPRDAAVNLFALPSDPTPIPPQFWGRSRCTRSPMIVGVSRLSPHTDPKLFGREIIFQEFQPM